MRTVVLYIMGPKYLGLSSLFSSVLSTLSLVEMGFGVALVVHMYKAIADGDEGMICALLNLYRRVFRAVGAFVLVAGVCSMPFLPLLIKGDIPPDLNLYALYLIYLVNTSLTYLLFSYKSSLLYAFQREDILNNVSTVLTVLEYGAQIALVCIFKNYYLYVALFPVFTAAGNLVRSRIVDKMFPNYHCAGEVPAERKRDLYKKVGALAMHKIGMTVSSSLNSAVISASLGLTATAIYGNYNYIATTVITVLTVIYSAMTAGVGNKMQTDTPEKNYQDFMMLSFFNQVMIIFCAGMMLCLYQPFMTLWAGRDLLLSSGAVIVFVLSFSSVQFRKVVLMYKDAQGLWGADKWKPLAGGLTTVAFMVLLAPRFGIAGIVLASVISSVLVEIPWETRVLFKHYFGRPTAGYVKQSIFILAPGGVMIAAAYFVTIRVNMDSSALTLLARAVVCAGLLGALLLLFAWRNPHFKRIMGMLPLKRLKRG